ncbi:MAG: hypothetical protein K0U78_15840, partial [Actinomycetia bacterium]|nr:hypothetical protein [Actinomycetes bacterium]
MDRTEIAKYAFPAVTLAILVAWALRASQSVRAYCQIAAGTGFSSLEIETMVQNLYAAFYSDPWFGEDEEAIIAILSRCETDADVAAVVCRFGDTSPWYLRPMTLFEAVRAYLSPSDIEQINLVLASKG